MNDCPFCENSENKKNKNSSSKIGKIFLVIILIFSAFAIYKSWPTKSSKQPLEAGAALQEQEKPQIGLLAPDFASEDVLGNKIALSDFRNQKPVLLVFWATWCGYCAKEKEDLKTFTKRYQDEIQVLAVDSGEPRQTIFDYIQKENINFLILIDEQRKIWNQYLVRGTPSHFLIGKDGRIITMRPGLAHLSDLEIMLTMLP